jgi:hypothetical protein
LVDSTVPPLSTNDFIIARRCSSLPESGVRYEHHTRLTILKDVLEHLVEGRITCTVGALAQL